jgi:hypothetical protein
MLLEVEQQQAEQHSSKRREELKPKTKRQKESP